jgi:hypothetical protein
MLAHPDFDFISQQVDLMAVLYFFSDESGKYRKNPVITVSGVGAPTDRLNKFHAEWETLLRSYGIGELKMSRIGDLKQTCGHKMPAGQSIEQRIQAILPFADCINEHMEVGLMQGWDVKGFNGLSMAVKSALGGSHDPFYLCFIRAMLQLGDYVPNGTAISLICDDDELTAWNAYCHYRKVSEAHKELGRKLAGITFAKSHFFTPLQAADLVAFLARRQASNQFWGKPNDFEVLYKYLIEGPKKSSSNIMTWYYSYVNEQGFVDLANDLIAKGEVKKYDDEPKGISKLRSDDAAVDPGSAQRDQGSAGRGESSENKAEKAEG